MTDHEIIGMFPTPLHISTLPRKITEDEYATVEKYRKDSLQNVGNTVSKETYILDKDLPDIRKFCEQCIDSYVSKIIVPGQNPDVEFYITQSWLNWTNPGESHHPHRHPNSIISGVFYFHAEGDSDRITFKSNLYGSNQILFARSPEDQNVWNSDAWYMPTNTGELFLFPSSTEHYVETTSSEGTRVSLAFNVFFRGTIGNERLLSQLKL